MEGMTKSEIADLRQLYCFVAENSHYQSQMEEVVEVAMSEAILFLFCNDLLQL